MYPKIALASASPRRRELLTQIGVNFELVSPQTVSYTHLTLPTNREV